MRQAGRVSPALLLLAALATAAAAPPRHHRHPTPPLHTATAGGQAAPKNATLVSFLTEISDWIMTTGVGTNVLNNASIFPDASSIFVNGDLARVLLAAAKITGKREYQEEGLRWCDAFVAKQLPITTSTGKAAGYWDTGYKQVFIADTGTAVAALALGWHVAEPPRKAKYLEAMQK